jgi:hypothetical protein
VSALRGTVRRVTGYTRHSTIVGGDVVQMRQAATVQIISDQDGTYLLRFDETGKFITDTWHESIQAAQCQARAEYGIDASDWEDDG